MSICIKFIDLNSSIINDIYLSVDSLSIVVLPTKRLIKHFLQYYGDNIDALPHIITYNDFFDSFLNHYGYPFSDETINIHALRMSLRNVERNYKLFNKWVNEAKDFRKFSGFSDVLLSFFSEMCENMLSLEVLKKTALYTEYEMHIDILNEIYEKFKEMLKKMGLIYKNEQKRVFDVKNHLKNRKIHIALSGFLTKYEIEVIKMLSNDNNVSLYLQIDKKIKKWDDILKNFGYNMLDVSTYNYHNNVHIYKFRSETEMASWIIERTRDELKNGVSADKMGVVLPSESLALMLRTMDGNLFNFANGFPISEGVFYSFLDIIINLFKNVTRFGFLRSDVEKLVSHPFLHVFENNVTNADSFSPYLDVDEKIKHFLYLDEFNKLYKSEKISLKVMAEKLYALLLSVCEHYDNIAKGSRYSALKKTTFDELNRMRMINDAYFDIELPGYEMFDYILLKLKNINYPDIVQGGVLVCGVLEARLLDFEVLIMPSLNDGIFPKQSKKDLFLNTNIRIQNDLPTQYDREDLQRLYFDLLVKRSKKVYLSYIERDDVGISHFLKDIIVKHSINVKEDLYVYRYIFDRDTKDAYTLKEPKVEIEKDKNIKIIRDMIFSASALTTYKQCGLKFYYKYILNLKSKDLDFKFDLGNLVHETLKELYIQNQNKSYSAINVIKTRFRDIFFKLMQTNHNFFYSPSQRLKAEYFFKRLESSYFFEREVSKDAYSVLTEFEIKEKIFNVNVYVKIDRINMYRDMFEIVDYKTGNINMRIDFDKPYDVQLPLYKYMAEKYFKKRCVATKYYDLKEEFMEKNLHYDLYKFEENLKNTISEILDVTVPFIMNELHCRYCDFKYICHKVNL